MLIVLPNAYGDPANNMAVDSALLETLPSKTAVFRHYGWTEPAFTFGYSQYFREVAQICPKDTSLCRRITGGGIVDHRNDWTYALILNRKLPASRESSTILYEKIHRSLAEAVIDQGTSARLSPCPKKCDEPVPPKQGPEQCFKQPVMYDVLAVNSSKIAGAAMKRNRNGLLIQGSIDRSSLPERFNFEKFIQLFTTILSNTLDLSIIEPDDLRPFFNSELIEREKNKFQSEAWTQRR